MSNTWVTCPRDRDTPSKGGLILDTLFGTAVLKRKGGSQGLSLRERPVAYQLVGGVTAHQGDDG